MYRIFVTREWPGDLLSGLEADRYSVEIWPEYTAPPSEVLRARAATCDVIVTTVEDRIDASVIEAGARSLRAITQAGVGVDNIDLDAAASFGIPVTNAPDVLTDATADLAFALMTAAARRIVEGDRYVRDGRWSTWHPSLLLGKALKGATVGVVGLGRIGFAFAERCRGFDMKVLYTARTEKPAAAMHGWRFAPLDKVLSQSDFVSLHVPLTNETRGLIGARTLSLMQPGSVIINTARGPVVDTPALVDALRVGRPGFAALDVTEPEPLPPTHDLLTLSNVIVTPHIGSSDHPSRSAMIRLAIENLRSILEGSGPLNPVGHSSPQSAV
jgi:glyoxylate reductase